MTWFGRGACGRQLCVAVGVAIACLLVAGVPITARAAAASAPTATSAAAAGTPTVAAQTPTVIQQPRSFGYVLGDTLTQRILLGSTAGGFQPAALPPVERAGLWFARRSSKIERTADDRRWLVIDYQLVNAPQTLMTVNLPTVTLKSSAGSEMAVPEFAISVGPLTPRTAFAKGDLQELRPDHPAPMLPTLTLHRQLEIWLSAFGLTVVIWLGWWLVRSLRAAANQPFARALREIRRTGDDSEEAWLALHRAFDRTADRALQTTTLPVLFRRAPYFESQRAAIEQFFAQSNLRFFGSRGGSAAGDGVGSANTPTPIPLRTFATTLRRIEKQHER